MKVAHKIEITTTGNGRWHWLSFPEVGNYNVGIQIGYGDTLKFLKDEVEWANKFNVYYENLNEAEEYCKKYLKICEYKEEECDDDDLIEEDIIEKEISTDIKTYLMKDSANNLYKIGKSIKPKYREKTLQSEKPTIKIVKVWDKNIERKLHILYNDYRIRGEWFELNKTQVRYICTHF